MAEIRALAMRGNAASQATETAISEQSQEVKALVSRFDGGSRSRDGNRKWKRNRDGNKGGGQNHGKPYRGGKNGGNNGGKNRGRRSSFNPHKFCVTHQAQGHDESECRKAAREKYGNNGNNNGNGNGNGNGNNGSRQTRSETYQPNFTQPSFPYSVNTINHIVNVTRFIDINSTEISPLLGDSDWIIDSAANAYTTPFKSDL